MAEERIWDCEYLNRNLRTGKQRGKKTDQKKEQNIQEKWNNY